MDETDKGNGATGKVPHGIRFVDGTEAVSDARLLFKECCASSFGFDLSFQDFARELAELPGEYVSPAGALLVAFCDGQPGGCVAMRPLGTGVCEMKRLYVRHTWRGKGVGRRLVGAVVEIVRGSGHEVMRVNALPWMREAIASYRSLGFEPIAPYRRNPIVGTQFLELSLTREQPPIAELRHLFELAETTMSTPGGRVPQKQRQAAGSFVEAGLAPARCFSARCLPGVLVCRPAF
ncbi:MAG: GNAT family N-acetyltransferase [Thermoanaerobaculaceae bacterium]|jgi:GNAT superfamily N-acetyltransferase